MRKRYYASLHDALAMQDNENRAKIRKKSEFHDRDWTFFSDHGYGKFEIDANRLPSATPHLVGFKRTDNPVDVFS